MTGNGVYVKSGAIINPLLPFHNCFFRNGETGGSLLTIDNDQTLTINDVEFLSGSRDALYNVTKTFDEGEITFENAVGTLAGEDFDNDSYNRIDWTYVYPDLEITNVVWSDTEPYVYDEVTVDVTITNNGNEASSICYLDLYYDLAAPPIVGEVGDKRTFVNGIPAYGSEVITIYQVWNNLDEIWNSYFQIDTDNTVAESDEDNNVWGPENLTWNPLPVIDDLSIQIISDDVELNWTYPISCDSFNIYKSLDPYDFSGATVETSLTNSYSEAIAETMYYRVTAVRECLPPTRETK